MPVVRKLSDDEVRTLGTKPLGERGRVAAEYDTYLLDFAPGDYGEVQLDDGDNRLTIRNRLQAAAARRDLTLSFRRTIGPRLRFQIVASTETTNTNGSDGTGAVMNTSLPVPSSVIVEAPASSASNSVVPVTAEAPKRRGRPPRTETVAVAAEVPSPKRRGRRPKTELVGIVPAVVEEKRRGRPRLQK